MKRIITAVGMVALTLCSAICADDPEGLRGVTGVAVVVEDIPAGGATIALAKAAIQTDVELKLRLAGLRILTGEETRLAAALAVNVNLTEDASAANVSVQFLQPARLVREPNAFLPLIVTWESSRVMSNPNSAHIRESVKDLVDELLNLWLKANPRAR